MIRKNIVQRFKSLSSLKKLKEWKEFDDHVEAHFETNVILRMKPAEAEACKKLKLAEFKP